MSRRADAAPEEVSRRVDQRQLSVDFLKRDDGRVRTRAVASIDCEIGQLGPTRRDLSASSRSTRRSRLSVAGRALSLFSARGASGTDALVLSVERESPDASGVSPRREISVPACAMAAESAPSRPGPPGEVNWEKLDKRKFFVGGAALFSGVTCALYPLTVIKTRQMVDGSGKSLSGVSIVRDILRSRGVLGLYQGFGTIVVGTLPIRMVYLSTLEVVKARARGVCEALDLPPIAHGIADAAGGATASMCSQVLGVPIDIISQRQMVQGVRVKSADGGSTTLEGYRNGWHALRHIVATDGVRGLYRGFGASVMTLVPGSALWWGARYVSATHLERRARRPRRRRRGWGIERGRKRGRGRGRGRDERNARRQPERRDAHRGTDRVGRVRWGVVRVSHHPTGHRQDATAGAVRAAGRRRAHVLEHGEGTLSGTRRRGVPSRRPAEDDLGVHMGDDHGHHLRVFEAVSVGGTRRRDVG